MDVTRISPQEACAVTDIITGAPMWHRWKRPLHGVVTVSRTGRRKRRVRIGRRGILVEEVVEQWQSFSNNGLDEGFKDGVDNVRHSTVDNAVRANRDKKHFCWKLSDLRQRTAGRGKRRHPEAQAPPC